MKRFIKMVSAVLVIAALAACAVSCGVSGKAKYDTSITGEGTNIRMSVVATEIDKYEVSDFEASKQKSDYVLIKIKNYGEIVVALRSDVAPITVANFKSLVSAKFYDGTVFHRVIEDFMIQGGGYTYMGDKLTERDADAIKGEFTSNGVTNNLAHIRGVISMARTSVPDSASSQFFIMHQVSTSLDQKYAAFGYVLAGMDVVDKIAVTNTTSSGGHSDVPVDPVVIESITFVQPK